MERFTEGESTREEIKNKLRQNYSYLFFGCSESPVRRILRVFSSNCISI